MKRQKIDGPKCEAREDKPRKLMSAINAYTFEDCVPKWLNSKVNFCRPNLRKLFCVFHVCLANESFKKYSCYVSFEAKHYIKLHVDYSDAYILIHFRFPLIWQKFKLDTYHLKR